MKTPYTLDAATAKMLEQRLNDELDAFYFYRSAAAWCKNTGFKYAASFFAHESDEELVHAKKLEQYLTDWNMMPRYPAIEEPETKFNSLVDIIEKAYELEYDLYESYEKDALKLLTKDVCTFGLFQELLKIQLSSIALYSDMINELQLIDADKKMDIYYIEKRLFKHG